jgi:hypothetical protein
MSTGHHNINNRSLKSNSIFHPVGTSSQEAGLFTLMRQVASVVAFYFIMVIMSQIYSEFLYQYNSVILKLSIHRDLPI